MVWREWKTEEPQLSLPEPLFTRSHVKFDPWETKTGKVYYCYCRSFSKPPQTNGNGAWSPGFPSAPKQPERRWLVRLTRAARMDGLINRDRARESDRRCRFRVSYFWPVPCKHAHEQLAPRGVECPHCWRGPPQPCPLLRWAWSSLWPLLWHPLRSRFSWVAQPWDVVATSGSMILWEHHT
jgi:hypothetical protein